MAAITFNDVPNILVEVNHKMDLLLAEYRKESVSADTLMTVEGYRDYEERKTGRKPSRQTIYDRVFKRKMPSERHGKYLYFRRSVMDAWFDNGRQIE